MRQRIEINNRSYIGTIQLAAWNLYWIFMDLLAVSIYEPGYKYIRLIKSAYMHICKWTSHEAKQLNVSLFTCTCMIHVVMHTDEQTVILFCNNHRNFNRLIALTPGCFNIQK